MKTLRLEGGMNYLRTTEGFKDLQKHENDHRGPGDERELSRIQEMCY